MEINRKSTYIELCEILLLAGFVIGFEFRDLVMDKYLATENNAICCLNVSLEEFDMI